MATGFRFTTGDLERLPEIEGIHYEIIDGELYVSRQPDELHQYACTKLAVALEWWSDQSRLGMTVFAPGLVFSEDNDVIPDLVWISHERRALARDGKGHYSISPEIVVEVLSPGSVNEQRDRELKLALYSRQGAEEYWIVDWQHHLVEVYRRAAERLRLEATLSDGEVLASPRLPGFACEISSLWAPPLRD